MVILNGDDDDNDDEDDDDVAGLSLSLLDLKGNTMCNIYEAHMAVFPHGLHMCYHMGPY